MKELHIINVGISIMINYKRKENISREIKIAKASDNNLCKKSIRR